MGSTTNLSSRMNGMNGHYSTEIKSKYLKYQLHSLIGVFIGYMCYYIVRNNFVLSTPYLAENFLRRKLVCSPHLYLLRTGVAKVQ